MKATIARYTVVLNVDPDTTLPEMSERLHALAANLLDVGGPDPDQLWRRGVWPLYGGAAGEEVIGSTRYQRDGEE